MNEKTCVILCRFRDDTGGLLPTPAPATFYNSYFFSRVGGGLGDYYREVTNFQIEIVGSVFGWFDIGHTLSEHKAPPLFFEQRKRAYNWGIAAARANGVPVDSFPLRVVFINFDSDAGFVVIDHGMLIAHSSTALFNHVFMEHEFGHVLGLQHSWSTPPDVHHPWRSTAWEIHPIIKIEVME